MPRLNVSVSTEQYGKLGLSENPFPYAPIPGDEPAFFCNQKDAMASVAEMLSGSFRTGKSSHMILLGSYGNGKTHALKHIRSQLRRGFSRQRNGNVVSAYASQPGETFLETYRELMYDLGYQELKRLSGIFLGSVASRGRAISLSAALKRWEKIRDGEALLSDILPRAFQLLNGMTRFMDFTKAFVNLSLEERSDAAWEWLSGEGTELSRRKELSISANLTPTSSTKALLSLRSTVQQMGFRSLVLLIDELEVIAGLREGTRQRMLGSFRQIIDTSPQGLNAVFACTPEAWQSILASYHAFSERINRETQLRPFDYEHTKELVQVYLASGRKVSCRGTEPFTTEAIHKVFELSMGNIRRVLLFCNRLVDFAATQSHPRIEAGTVDDLMSQSTPETTRAPGLLAAEAQ